LAGEQGDAHAEGLVVIERLADLVMPWAATHATVWPSQHAVHEGLMIEYVEACNALRELVTAYDVADVERIVVARERAQRVLDGVPAEDRP
jgi:hypothetical protein